MRCQPSVENPSHQELHSQVQQSSTQVDRCFQQNQNNVERKIQCINDWIEEEQKPQYKQKIIQSTRFPHYAPYTGYKVKVSDESHFAQRPGIIPGWLDVFSMFEDLKTQGQLNLFKNQVKAVFSFLETVNDSMRGGNIHWFHTVNICPNNSPTAKQLSLSAGTLTVWLKSNAGVGGNYHTLNSSQILDKWGKLDMKTDFIDDSIISSTFGNYKRLWALVNPIGTLRGTARSRLFSVVETYFNSSNSYLSNPTANRAQLVSDLNDMAGTSANYVTDLEGKVSTANNRGQLGCVANNIKSKIQDGNFWNSVSQCNEKNINGSIENNVTIDNVLVYVGNLHDINISVGTCTGSLQKHIADDETLKQTVNIKNTLVAVHTVDQVSVHVNFPLAAILENALDSCL